MVSHIKATNLSKGQTRPMPALNLPCVRHCTTEYAEVKEPLCFRARPAEENTLTGAWHRTAVENSNSQPIRHRN